MSGSSNSSHQEEIDKPGKRKVLVEMDGDLYTDLKRKSYDTRKPMAELVREGIVLRVRSPETPDLPRMLKDLGWPYQPEGRP